MATEPLQAAPYAVGTDAPDGPAQLLALASWARRQVVQIYASSAARSAAFTAASISPAEGMLSWLQDVDRYETYNGTTWVPFLAANGKGTVLNVTTDASSDITVTHGMGATPSQIFVQDASALGSSGRTYTVHTVTSTTFKVRVWFNDLVQPSNAGWTFYWHAYL